MKLNYPPFRLDCTTLLRGLGFLIAGSAIALMWEGAALAYIDPVTSGTLMQILAPILVALGVMRQRVALFMHLVVAKLRRAIGIDERE